MWFLSVACISLCTIGVGAPAANAACAQTECMGTISNPHIHDQYDFTTYSRVYEQEGYHFFETCVKNNRDNDLPFNWYIPGPNSWLLSGCALSNPRVMQTGNKLDTHRGCVMFGNSGLTTRAEFIPHESDKAKIDKESPDCTIDSTAITGTPPLQPNKAESSTNKINVGGEIFAPSVLADPEHTMSRIRYTAGLTQSPDSGTFTQTIDLSVEVAHPEKDNQYVKEFFLRPDVSLAAEYNTAYNKGMDQPILFSDKAQLSVQGKIPANPILTSVQYMVLSSEGKEVAGFWVPILTSNQQ